MSVIDKLVRAAVSVFDTVVDVLPAPLAARAKQARKSLVNVAGSVVTLAAAFHDLPFVPQSVQGVVAVVVLVATAIVHYAVPNDEA